MALFVERNPLINAGAAWVLPVNTGALGDQRPFSSLNVQNYGLMPVDFYVDATFMGKIDGYTPARFAGVPPMPDNLIVLNTSALAIPADKIVITMATNNSSVDLAMGASIANDIDLKLYPTDVEIPLAQPGDAHRFAPYFELSVTSFGGLTPGVHKVYHGSNCGRELLNVGSYYNYEQMAENKFYDLNTIKLKCSNPYSLVTPENGGFELGNMTNWSNSGEASANYQVQQGAKHSGANAGMINVTALLPNNPYHSFSLWYHKVGAITTNDAYACSIWMAATGPRAAYFRCIREIDNIVQYDTADDVKYHFETNNGWQCPGVTLPASSQPSKSTTGITMRVGFLKDARTQVGDVIYPDDFQVLRKLGLERPTVAISGGY